MTESNQEYDPSNVTVVLEVETKWLTEITEEHEDAAKHFKIIKATSDDKLCKSVVK